MKTSRPLHLTSQYSTSAENIFNAWTRPEMIRKWLFRGPTSEVRSLYVDLRVHGKFSILEVDSATGDSIDHFGQYLEINLPTRLVFTLEVPKHFQGITKVVIEIEQTDDGTRLSLIQTGVSAEITESNWIMMLKQLGSLVAQGHVE